jgi:hypothetical protein
MAASANPMNADTITVRRKLLEAKVASFGPVLVILDRAHDHQEWLD